MFLLTTVDKNRLRDSYLTRRLELATYFKLVKRPQYVNFLILELYEEFRSTKSSSFSVCLGISSAHLASLPEERLLTVF